MREPTRDTARLPRQLLVELGVSGDRDDSSRRKRRGPINRKEQRKAARVQKKSGSVLKNKAHLPKQTSSDSYRVRSSKALVAIAQPKNQIASVEPGIPKSILKGAKTQSTKSEERIRSRRQSLSPSPPLRLSRSVRDKLAEDDADIASLERALGVKGKKNLPKSFEEDSLGSLLEGIDDAVGLNEGRRGKRKRNEEKDWLERKRQKANSAVEAVESLDSEDFEGNNAHMESDSDGSLEDEEASVGSTDDDGFDGFGTSDRENDELLPKVATKRTRENPYAPPVDGTNFVQPVKYVPPSLRTRDLTASEDLSQLRRQIQGLLNRLSEANIISVLGDVEKLYQNNPRQHVNSTMLDLLLGLLADPTPLQDTFIILHAGFIAALYKAIGTDFGAQAIQRIDEVFDQTYRTNAIEESSGKKLINLISLLSELYNFQVIGSNLIYDYIRLCLGRLSETNTELLLKVVRNAGQQLRQDDPSSLKDIIVHIQAAIAEKGEENLSVRTRYMIETINNLKNNRMKTGVAASTITSEHTIRMKKTLGSLNTRSVKASEPLRIGMKDLRDRDKIGTWWLVGASYKGHILDRDEPAPVLQANGHEDEELKHADTGTASLVQLAKEQRMNTDVRRSIFVSIMSSTDYNDAYVRLMKLRLKRAQELEIPKVLIHCAGAEKVYNPFYTFLSRRVCSDKKCKMAFQFSLWNLFKQMGEGDDDLDDEQENEGKERIELRSLVNLAKMFGVLIAEGGLSLGILKNLNFVYLQPKTQTFLEILLITAILHSQQGSAGQKNEKAVVDMFMKPTQMPEMASGLRYFLKRVVRKSDVAGGESERKTIRWGCKIVDDALSDIATQTMVDE